jgi:hypothetical protein
VSKPNARDLYLPLFEGERPVGTVTKLSGKADAPVRGPGKVGTPGPTLRKARPGDRLAERRSVRQAARAGWRARQQRRRSKTAAA